LKNLHHLLVSTHLLVSSFSPLQLPLDLLITPSESFPALYSANSIASSTTPTKIEGEGKEKGEKDRRRP
jgi:hypothetical protein